MISKRSIGIVTTRKKAPWQKFRARNSRSKPRWGVRKSFSSRSGPPVVCLTFLGSKLLYAIDTHTHADHNSACKILRERCGVKIVMHRATDAPYVDLRVEDRDEIKFGQQSLKIIHTPGHTEDAMCLLFSERIFTGDTLLIGGWGRT